MQYHRQWPRVGFVGLGIMGTPMAGHLADSGSLVAVFDIDARAAASFVAAHPATAAAASPAELASTCSVVITMLPDGNVVREVVLGPDGLMDGLAAGSLLIDTSSSQPWITQQTAASLSAKGVPMVDAPVSGAQWGAQAAELVFMVGGAASDVERARPLLDILGRAVFHLGPLGSGHVMKSINNTVTAMTLEATLEGLALGVRAGLNPRVMNGVFNESTASSWITRTHIDQRILSGTFDDPFRLALMRKDIDITNRLAAQLELDLPMAELCAMNYREADEEAGPGSSLSEVGHWVERRTGVTLGG
jgi:3-hydroxyisobutyrate dehydrogenase-like beta-hydroxyacid dehydrogenase